MRRLAPSDIDHRNSTRRSHRIAPTSNRIISRIDTISLCTHKSASRSDKWLRCRRERSVQRAQCVLDLLTIDAMILLRRERRVRQSHPPSRGRPPSISPADDSAARLKKVFRRCALRASRRARLCVHCRPSCPGRRNRRLPGQYLRSNPWLAGRRVAFTKRRVHRLFRVRSGLSPIRADGHV